MQLRFLPGQPKNETILLGEVPEESPLVRASPRQEIRQPVCGIEMVSFWLRLSGHSQVHLIASKTMAYAYTTTHPQYSIFIFIHTLSELFFRCHLQLPES